MAESDIGSFLSRDSFGRTGWSSIQVLQDADNADLDLLRIALQAMMQATVSAVVDTRVVQPDDGLKGGTLEFGAITQAARMTFKDDNDLEVIVFVLGPSFEIFEPDGETVDETDLNVAAWITLMLSIGRGPGDTPLVEFIGGKRVSNLMGWQQVIGAAAVVRGSATKATWYEQDGIGVKVAP